MISRRKFKKPSIRSIRSQKERNKKHSLQFISFALRKRKFLFRGLDEKIKKVGIFTTLNFYCLVHICSFLKLNDFTTFDKVSEDFKPVFEQTYKMFKSFDTFDFHTISPVKFYAARIVLNKIGRYIKSIKIDREDLLIKTTYFYVDRLFLEMVFQFCPNLENISIKSFYISAAILLKMSKLFKKLKSIEFIHCYIGGNSWISNIKNLFSLNLRDSENIQPKYFTNFCLNNKNLIQLDIIKCDSLTSKSATDITTILLNLEELAISSQYTNMKSNDFFKFADLPKLKKLYLRCNKLAKIENLLIKFAEKDLLQYLDISGVQTSRKLIEILASFKKLEIIKINLTSHNFNDWLLSILSTKVNIKELHLFYSLGITSSGLVNFVERSPNIRVLDIRRCKFITNDFYYSVLKILKEQNRQHSLTVFVYDTEIFEKKIDPDLIAENLPWIQLKFENCETYFNEFRFF